MPKPLFTHDCMDCIWLGPYGPGNATLTHDLYFCPASETVIARYANNPGEYTSGIAFVGKAPELTEAFARAYSRGLFTVKAV